MQFWRNLHHHHDEPSAGNFHRNKMLHLAINNWCILNFLRLYIKTYPRNWNRNKSILLRTKTLLCFSTGVFFDSTKSPYSWSRPLLRMIHQCITPENKGQDSHMRSSCTPPTLRNSLSYPTSGIGHAVEHVPQTGQMWEMWMVGRLLFLPAGNLFLYFKELIYKTGKKQKKKREKRTGCLRCTSY